MTTETQLALLTQMADRVDKCVQEALVPVKYPGFQDITYRPDPRIVSLINALEAIADGLRALAKGDV